MLRRLNKKGQSTGEYALVFALALGAVMAMQVMVKRGIQARIKNAADYITDGIGIGNMKGLTQLAAEEDTLGWGSCFSTMQYEPYYYYSKYTTDRNSSETEQFIDGGAASGGKQYTVTLGDADDKFSANTPVESISSWGETTRRHAGGITMMGAAASDVNMSSFIGPQGF
jgi:hypothetical protein